MHAKLYLSDDYLTVIGSANLDNLSMFLNYEMVTLLYDERICPIYKQIFLSDIQENCVEITPEMVRSWPVTRHVRNWVTRALGGSMG